MNPCSRIQINKFERLLKIDLCEEFNEIEAEFLICDLKKLALHYQINVCVFIIPKKWKATQPARRIIRNFMKQIKNFKVSSSPIQRAILKTEAIYDDEDVNCICKNYKEALTKIYG